MPIAKGASIWTKPKKFKGLFRRWKLLGLYLDETGDCPRVYFQTSKGVPKILLEGCVREQGEKGLKVSYRNLDGSKGILT